MNHDEKKKNTNSWHRIDMKRVKAKQLIKTEKEKIKSEIHFLDDNNKITNKKLFVLKDFRLLILHF